MIVERETRSDVAPAQLPLEALVPCALCAIPIRYDLGDHGHAPWPNGQEERWCCWCWRERNPAAVCIGIRPEAVIAHQGFVEPRGGIALTKEIHWVDPR